MSIRFVEDEGTRSNVYTKYYYYSHMLGGIYIKSITTMKDI